MNIPGLSPLVELSRQALRWLVGGWSLQRKSLLFLGIALMVPIGLAFWFLSQLVARDLVRETTRQSARDHARSVVAWKHVESPNFARQSSLGTATTPSSPLAPDRALPAGRTYYEPEVYAILRTQLVDNPYFREKFLMLDEEVMHENLGSADLPASDGERKLLARLESRYRQRLSQPLVSDPAANLPTPPQSSAVADAAKYFALPGLEDLYEETGPVFDDQDTPDGGWYVYYHVVQFPERCMICHPRTCATRRPMNPVSCGEGKDSVQADPGGFGHDHRGNDCHRHGYHRLHADVCAVGIPQYRA